MYTMVGVTKALDVGFPYVGAVAVGSIAAVAGGLIRDILSSEVPETLRPGTPYLTAALAGGIIFALCEVFGVPQTVSIPGAIALIIGLRFVSMGFGWQTPEPQAVSAAISTAAQTTPTVVRKIPLIPLKAPKAVAPIGRHLHRNASDEVGEAAPPDSPPVQD